MNFDASVRNTAQKPGLGFRPFYRAVACVTLGIAMAPAANAGAESVTWDNLPALFKRRYEERAPDHFAITAAARDLSLTGFRFDPVVTTSLTSTAGTRSIGTSGSTTAKALSVTTRVTQSSPYGTELTISHEKTNDTVLDPQNNGGPSLGAEISQKLLKGGPFFGPTNGETGDLTYELALLKDKTRFDDLLFEAFSALAGVEEADLSLVAARRAEATALEQAKAVEGLVQSGYKPKADLLVSEQATILAAEGVHDAENRAALSHRRLELAVFQNEGDEPLAVTRGSDPAVPASTATNVDDADQILAKRLGPLKAAGWPSEPPKIKEARLGAGLAHIHSREAYRDDLPDLSVNAAMTRPANGGELARTYGVTLSVPLRSAITRDASALAGLKSFEADAVLQRAAREFASERQTYEEKKKLAEKTFAAARRLKALAERTLVIEQQKYADGKSTIADVRRVQEDLDGAAQNLLRARTTLLVSYLEAAKAAGQLAVVTLETKP